MSNRSAKLRLRLGCPLALLLAAALTAAVETLAYGRTFQTGEWQSFLLLAAFIGLPFGVLALACVRDLLAWLIALALTIGLWAYMAHADRGSTDFVWGFAVLLAPLTIAGLCLAVAGMRGRIAWATEGARKPQK
jgi:hypothetical protein